MTTTASSRLLVGRTITSVELHTRRTEQGQIHDPVITLDNGAKVFFVVQETDEMEYGIRPLYLKPRKDG
jgi:hypothetical protein